MKTKNSFNKRQFFLILFLISLCTQLGAHVNDDIVNFVIGDISFIKKFGIKPDKHTGENLRIKTHLEYVENLLRQKDVSYLTDQQKKRREIALELLHQYWLAGIFPKNYDYPGKRKPCFEDKDGNICAVGYLIANTAGHDLVEKINYRHQYDYIKDMTFPEIPVWCDQYGLTLVECAMIQPTYYDSEGKVKYSLGPYIPIERNYKDTIRYVNNKNDFYSDDAEKKSYCVLSENAYLYKIIKKTKDYPADSIIKIGIKTNCEPGKEGEWNCYRFITPLKASGLMAIGDKVPRFLIINNKPFTGYLKIVKNIDTDINMHVLQFNNGYYETGDVINNPYCTLRHYDYNLPPPINYPAKPPPQNSSDPIYPSPHSQ